MSKYENKYKNKKLYNNEEKYTNKVKLCQGRFIKVIKEKEG